MTKDTPINLCEIEIKLHGLIKATHGSIVATTPADGFNSPRDVSLVTTHNKKLQLSII